ncbi:uncharacterized protein LOC128960291 [Oppia nitens]|uniref:uncharacterized protein LOC128960291 n=1 Tax=Oppia nitens TaxID=1686743 RepID=UPI0023DAF4BF|nr:uncharacterized protein LOC128960291 [Oppia nitens]
MTTEIQSQNPILNDLKNFLQFVCENKSCSVDSVINSSLTLLNGCPSSREAVLHFYSQLFDDYCAEYCVQNQVEDLKSPDRSVSGQRVGPIIGRFIAANKSPMDSNATHMQTELISVRKVSTDSRRQSTDCSEDTKVASHVDDCPQSPTAVSSIPMELSDSMTITDYNHDLQDVMNSLDFYFMKISETLLILIESESNTLFTKFITEWALELAAKLSAKFGRFGQNIPNFVSKLDENDPNMSLSSSLSFWMQCPAMQALTNVTIRSNTIELEGLVKQMLEYSPHCDWILAHLITTMSNNSRFTSYIEQLIQSSSTSPSVTCILSYLSEHNPRAIVNASKTNISFLLKLSTNSKPLLDLLVSEATKQFDIKTLNELVVSTKPEELNDHIIYCITNADNAFDLLRLAFDISIHSEATEALKARTHVILSSIISHIHDFIYVSNRSLANTPPILSLLKNNVNGLVIHTVKTLNPSLRLIQLRLLHLLCMHYGLEFITEVFYHILSTHSHTSNNSFRNPVSNPILSPLIKSLKLLFGAQIYDCLNNTLKLPHEKSVNYWSHLTAAVEVEPVCLDIELLCSFFSDNNFDTKTKIYIKYYILRLLLKTIEKFPKKIIAPQHRLCLSIVSTYFKLIDLQTNCSETELDFYMETLFTCQKLMTILAKSYDINEYILSRVLLELTLENSHLFSKNGNIGKNKYKSKLSTFESISLLKENASYDLVNSKFRKMPLINGKLEVYSNYNNIEEESMIMNQPIVLDAFKCCVTDMVSFAKLLVQCVSPDLLFNDNNIWGDDDAKDGQLQNLRVTIERDLYIWRTFKANPLLWNLCELIGSSGHLSHCFVLIRALMTVQRTHWASTSVSTENISETQRLLNLLSNTHPEILPSKPFKHVAIVLPELQAWEVSCILNDICRYLKDSTSDEMENPSMKPYLEKLRIIMAHNLPGPLFVKIFKDIKKVSFEM